MTTKRFLLLLAAALTLLPAAAGAGSGEQILTLHAKNPVTWRVVEGGASGALVYDEGAGNFTFSAQGLPPATAYALVRHDDDPADGRILARGVTDERGALRLAGEWRDWTKKFWLVLASDLAERGERARLTAWNPKRYLFEYKELGPPCDECYDEWSPIPQAQAPAGAQRVP